MSSEGEAPMQDPLDELLPREDALRHALAQAPDRSALPDWRVRQAILDHAHEAVSASEELLAASRSPGDWWRPAWWRAKQRSPRAMPWNAAFATVLLGVFVALMWQREPIPDAQLDERVAAPEAPPAAPVAETPPPPEPPAPVAATPPPAAAAKSPPVSKPVADPVPALAPEPPPTPIEAAPGNATRPPAASAQGSVSSQDAAARQKKAVPPLEAAAPRAPVAADVPRAAPAPRPGVRTDATPPPDFVSLARWTHLRIANVNGEVRVLPRDEAGELSLLMNSAAIMAVGSQPLRMLPQWRVVLERKGDVLAVLEVGSKQVRWTEGGSPPATGMPPPEALEALHLALRETIRSKVPARKAPPAKE